LYKLNKPLRLFWRTNHEITARELRVIGADGKQIGIMSTLEALKLAKEAKLDLVEITAKANPPIAKVVDYSKFRYREEKKLKAQTKKNKGGELKEIRFSPFIAENDYQTRLERVREFLAQRNKVRLVVVFKGRQLGSKRFGYELLNRVNKELGENISIDSEPKFFGRHLATVISPRLNIKKQNNNGENQNQEINNKTL